MAALLDKPVVFLRFSLLAFLVLPLQGCPPVRPPTSPDRILEWTLGPQHLASPTSPDVFLVLIPKEKLKPPSNPHLAPQPPSAATGLAEGNAPMRPDDALSACLPATSVLPAPLDDGRIFLAVEGAVHALHPPDKTVTALGIAHSFGHVNALLAVRKVERGLEIVAAVNVENKSEPEIHVLVVDNDKIVRSNVADFHFQNASELFQVYAVPHCNRDGKECLAISNNDETTYLEKRFTLGGANSITLAEFKGAQDAVWTPADDGSVYVLKACLAR